ncbi:MAG: MOSC domain-containing protein, partial [Pseudomonadota bacterium]
PEIDLQAYHNSKTAALFIAAARAGAVSVGASDLAWRALGEHLGHPMQVRRFRGNLWLEGLAPWEEEAWVGREIAIGDVRFRVDEPIGRCRATEASPVSGGYDAPTVAGLRKARGHTEFGVYATVIEGGVLAEGAAVSA